MELLELEIVWHLLWVIFNILRVIVPILILLILFLIELPIWLVRIAVLLAVSLVKWHKPVLPKMASYLALKRRFESALDWYNERTSASTVKA